MPHVRRLSWLILLGLLLPAAVGPSGAERVVKVGALFPLAGFQAPLAREEYAGVQLARDLVNAEGGIGGRSIELVERALSTREEAGARVEDLVRAGARVIVGTYSSSLSLPASEAAAARGLLYWEAGAVADQVTGRGLPSVFRVGATGRNLGALSSHFTAEVLAPRLGRAPSAVRMAVVQESDAYGTSVGQSAQQEAVAVGISLVAVSTYDSAAPDWPRVFTDLRSARPDVIVLAANIPNGVAFRRTMLATSLRVSALIGSTMAQCGPEFGALLESDAIGVFASDRPTAGFNPGALNPTGKAMYARLAQAHRARYQREPTEESLAGFAAAWALFHYVLPAAQRAGDLTPEGMARAARALDLEPGTLANGAGVRFASTPDALGQNLRASSVIWQWQGVRHSVTVYPAIFATAAPILVPLPR